MSGFFKLPNEILDLVLVHLKKHDWATLTRCCHQLYNRINPMLYHSIETPCYCIDVHKTLVYTLLTHPELAHSVRSLKIGRLPYGADPKSYSNHQHAHHDMLTSKGLFQFLHSTSSTWRRRLSDIIQTLADRNWERTQWLEALQSGTHRDPWLAILLSLLPNLEIIDLFWGGTGTHYSSWVLSKIYTRCTPFAGQSFWSNLHTTILKIPDDEGADTDFYRFIPFFVLPSIRTFKGHLLTDRYLEPNLGVQRSPLTTLEFIQCSSVLGFNYLIKICPDLEVFTYTQQEDDCLPGSPGYNNVYFDTLRPTPLKEALATRKDTLQSVTVDVSRQSSNYGGFYSDDWIGCMQDFIKLRTLRIRAANFLGLGRRRRTDVNPIPRVSLIEFVPSCIEEVWITEVEDRVLGTVVLELLGLVSARDRFAKLRRIDLEGRKWLKGGVERIGEESWRKLYPNYGVLMREDVIVATEEARSACLERGIEFYVRDTGVEAAFEEYGDVFLFVRGNDEVEDN